MQNWLVNQSALLSESRTDLRHQYGISGGESQTSIFASGANEGRLYSRAIRTKGGTIRKVMGEGRGIFRIFFAHCLLAYGG